MLFDYKSYLKSKALQVLDIPSDREKLFEAIDKSLHLTDKVVESIEDPEHQISYHAKDLPDAYRRLAKTLKEIRDILEKSVQEKDW